MFGPGEAAFVSASDCFDFGEDIGSKELVFCGMVGGGSISEWAGEFGTIGSGRGSNVSSAEDVSIVICVVGGGADLRAV